jgi:hypothetical protein
MFDRVLVRVLCVALLPVPLTAGCTAMRDPSAVASAGDSGDDGWLTGARRRLAQAAREIEADLDFHENEGLDAFAPDAAGQVNMLRGDMNGPSGTLR